MRGFVRWYIGSDTSGFGMIESGGALYFFRHDSVVQHSSKFKSAVAAVKHRFKPAVLPGHTLKFTPAPEPLRGGGPQYNVATQVKFDLLQGATSQRAAKFVSPVGDGHTMVAACPLLAKMQAPVPARDEPEDDAEERDEDEPPPDPSGAPVKLAVARGVIPLTDRGGNPLDGGSLPDYYRDWGGAFADEWIDRQYPAGACPDVGVLFTACVVQGGKGDLALASKLASYFKAHLGVREVGLATIPDALPNLIDPKSDPGVADGIVQSLHPHKTHLLELCSDPGVAVLVSDRAGLASGRTPVTPVPPELANPALVIKMIQHYLYANRLSGQINADHESFKVSEAGFVASSGLLLPNGTYQHTETGFGVSPVERGLLRAPTPPGGANLGALSGSAANAGGEFKTELLGALGGGGYAGARRLYFSYGHMESYLAVFLGTIIAIEASKTDGKDVDVVMSTTRLDTGANSRHDIDFNTVVTAADQLGLLADFAHVVAVRGLGVGATKKVMDFRRAHAPASTATRRLRIIDPYFNAGSVAHELADWAVPGQPHASLKAGEGAANAGANATPRVAGLSMADVGLVQKFSEPFVHCTGENSLAEVAALDKVWLYEVLSFKRGFYASIQSFAEANGCDQDVLDFLADALSVGGGTFNINRCVLLAAQIGAHSFAEHFKVLDRALANDLNAYERILVKARRLLYHWANRCAGGNVIAAVRELEKLIYAVQGSIDTLPTDAVKLEQLRVLLACLHELVTQSRVAGLRVEIAPFKTEVKTGGVWVTDP